MVSEKRKKLQPPKKRLEVTDASGWTHVVHGRRNNVSDVNHLDLQLDALQIPDKLSLDELLTIHDRYLRLWEASECWKSVVDLFKNVIFPDDHIRLTKCVCLGLGSLSAGRDSSRFEFAALVAFLNLLGEKHIIQDIIVQDPAFNGVDETLLNKNGFTVVATPSGFESIDESTFLFAPHLEQDIFAEALRKRHPAVCIGNSDILSDRPLHSSAENSKTTREIFQPFVKATESKPLPDFDRDTWCQFTSMYWLRGGAG